MDIIKDPSLALYLPLWKKDGASFMSDDAYGHTCTVTGTVQGVNGKYFDGSADLIDLGTSMDIGASDFTVVFSAVNTGTGGRYLWGWYDGAGDYCLGRLLGLDIDFGGNRTDLEYNTGIADGDWGHFAYTVDRDGDSTFLFNGDVKKVVSTEAHGNITFASAQYIGKVASQSAWGGTVGELLFYKRALTPLEIQHNYEATKARYQ